MSAPVFTRFVQALPDGPSAALVDDVWSALAGALRRELRRRGLWGRSPSYLGVHGWESWGEEARAGAAPAPPRPGGALEELVAECYAYVFVARLRSLRAQLAVKPNVEGLVALNVRHFLFERQRKHDPIGFRIFELARDAVELAVEAGELRLSDEEGRLSNASRLATVRPASERRIELAPLVARWAEEIVPEPLAAPGAHSAAAVERLRARLAELPAAGVCAFSFKELVDPLKRVAWRHWAQQLDRLAGEAGAGVGAHGRPEPHGLPPDESFEHEQSYRKLLGAVTATLAELEVDARTRGYLLALWGHLARAESEVGDPAPEERRPSNRKLAARLGIPRERLPDLLATLGDVVRRHLALPRHLAPPRAPRAHRGQIHG